MRMLNASELDPKTATPVGLPLRAALGSIPASLRQVAVRARRNGPVGGAAKRSLDVALVILAVPLLLPLMLGIAVLLKMTDPGPLLYGHRRIGFDGRPFRCWKFRSMVVNGDEVLARYLAEHPEQAEVWRTQRKLDDDPRVTRVGAVLRKLSLDELPQLLNVLKGEMSLVGPRPVVQAELDDHYGAASVAYLAARPGLSGLWQISGRSDTTYEERIRLDCDYVQRWSLWRDIRIIFLTIPALALSKGAR